MRLSEACRDVYVQDCAAYVSKIISVVSTETWNIIDVSLVCEGMIQITHKNRCLFKLSVWTELLVQDSTLCISKQFRQCIFIDF